MDNERSAFSSGSSEDEEEKVPKIDENLETSKRLPQRPSRQPDYYAERKARRAAFEEGTDWNNQKQELKNNIKRNITITGYNDQNLQNSIEVPVTYGCLDQEILNSFISLTFGVKVIKNSLSPTQRLENENKINELRLAGKIWTYLTVLNKEQLKMVDDRQHSVRKQFYHYRSDIPNISMGDPNIWVYVPSDLDDEYYHKPFRNLAYGNFITKTRCLKSNLITAVFTTEDDYPKIETICKLRHIPIFNIDKFMKSGACDNLTNPIQMLDKANLLFKPEFLTTYSDKEIESATTDPTMTKMIKHSHFKIFKDKFVLIGYRLRKKFSEYEFEWKAFVEEWGGVYLEDHTMAYKLTDESKKYQEQQTSSNKSSEDKIIFVHSKYRSHLPNN